MIENPLISIWIRREKSRHKHGFKIRLGTKMHKLFNAWCRRFGGGKPVTAFRFFFKGKLIDGEQTAADIDIRRAIDLDVADYINVTSLPEVTLPITRSNSKKIRENVRRLPHEVEATLSSWVKCTDPIPREILEEVRSTVLVWMKNVENYVEETETYILNDEHVHQEIVDEGLGCLWVDVHYPYSLLRKNSGTLSRVETSRIAGFRRRAWSRFIREMLLSDVNIIHQNNVDFHKIEIVFERQQTPWGRVKLVVYFHERLSSEIKDEICSKLASALRALKSRISRICGINELERRTQSH